MIVNSKGYQLPKNLFKNDDPETPLLFAILSLVYESSERASTSNIYKYYLLICREYNIKPLNENKINSIISRLVKIKALKSELVPKGIHGTEKIISFDKLK